MAALVVALLAAILLQFAALERTKKERDRYKSNSVSLLADVEEYRVRDSLNAVKAKELTLQLSELKRYRKEDAQLIRDMGLKLKNLQSAATIETETRTEFVTSVVRDTVIRAVHDTITAAIINYTDEWLTFQGRLENGQFRGNIVSRDSLLIAENVRYKRFLFWRTRRVKSRDFRVVSKNPHTKIESCEHIIVEN